MKDGGESPDGEALLSQILEGFISDAAMADSAIKGVTLDLVDALTI